MFASEPQILSPTNIDVDHRGRVWVCEVVNYRVHARNNKRPQDDHSTHSFVFGPDGKLYLNMGNNGGFFHDANGKLIVDTADNHLLDRRQLGRFKDAHTSYWDGMIFRRNPKRSEFEVLGHNFRNNFEVGVDSFGNVWQSDNDDDGNYGVRINYVLEGGNYGHLEELTGAGWRKQRVSQTTDVSSRHWYQNDPGVVPNFAQSGAGSPTGISVYKGELLPKVFHNQVIHCDAGPGVVWVATVKPDGGGFSGEIINLVKGERDKWFRPVDVAVVPDGALFVSDWYDPIVSWNRQADSYRGRI